MFFAERYIGIWMFLGALEKMDCDMDFKTRRHLDELYLTSTPLSKSLEFETALREYLTKNDFQGILESSSLFSAPAFNSTLVLYTGNTVMSPPHSKLELVVE